jgi:hypothetical protein
MIEKRPIAFMGELPMLRMASSDMLKVSIFEARGVFQAISQHSVKTNVRRPNQGKWQQLPLRCQNSDGDQNCRSKKRVNRVVDCSTNLGIDEIAEHEKIRREKKDSEQDPTRMVLAIQQDAKTENTRTFEPKEKGSSCKHLSILSSAAVPCFAMREMT